MENGLELLYDLYLKSKKSVSFFEGLPEKDIRRKHMELFKSQITITYLNLKINIRFSETNQEEFKDLFNSNIQQTHNYTHNLIQNLIQNLIDTSLFQTELVLRYYYSKLNNITPGKEKSLFKIIANLFDDTENKWEKEETKFLVLFWTLRNTIHTGGIYFDKKDGRKLPYKNKEYIFEYGKSPEFLKNNYYLNLIADLIDTLKILFESDKIKELGYLEHPNYYALE